MNVTINRSDGDGGYLEFSITAFDLQEFDAILKRVPKVLRFLSTQPPPEEEPADAPTRQEVREAVEGSERGDPPMAGLAGAPGGGAGTEGGGDGEDV